MATAAAPRTAADLKRPGAAGIYQRAFEKGLVLVNPTKQPIKVQLQRTMHNAIPQGGGKVGADGSVSPAGSLAFDAVEEVVVAASSAAILLVSPPVSGPA